MRVPFVDLKAQHAVIREEIRQAMDKVVDACDFILGSELARFETAFAAYLGTAHAIGLGNGLDALRWALFSLRIGNGDEVIIPANTYIATALAVSAVGARPVLVDAEDVSWNLNPELLEQAITPRTRAIILVHLYGQPADLDPILAVASSHGLRVIEDACQSHGARYRGKVTGTFGDIGCFSFYPSKNLGALGDGGAAVTGNSELADTLLQLRNYGQRKKYDHAIIGGNSRLDNLQAAVLSVKLAYLDRWNEMRKGHAALYGRLLSSIPEVAIPRVAPDRDHIFHLYVVHVPDRDRLQAHLAERGIVTQIHYPIPIHLQEAYRDLGYSPGAFPVTERAAHGILSLPMHPELLAEQIEYVADSIRTFYRH